MDALLAALDRLIAKQRDLKQAAMQQLLTGHTRLPGFAGNAGNAEPQLGQVNELKKAKLGLGAPGWVVKRLGELFRLQWQAELRFTRPSSRRYKALANLALRRLQSTAQQRRRIDTDRLKNSATHILISRWLTHHCRHVDWRSEDTWYTQVVVVINQESFTPVFTHRRQV